VTTIRGAQPFAMFEERSRSCWLAEVAERPQLQAGQITTSSGGVSH